MKNTGSFKYINGDHILKLHQSRR